jgi:hypothetical protein
MRNREAIEVYLKTLRLMRDETGYVMMQEWKSGNGEEYRDLWAIHEELESTVKAIQNIANGMKN